MPSRVLIFQVFLPLRPLNIKAGQGFLPAPLACSYRRGAVGGLENERPWTLIYYFRLAASEGLTGSKTEVLLRSELAGGRAFCVRCHKVLSLNRT